MARRWGWPIWLALPLAGLGLWQTGEGLYIQAKAVAAQWLLQRAWDRTLAGETAVRPWPWADTWPVARLTAPGHGIDLIVLDGASGRTLTWGPGHLAGTAAPGTPGLALLSGHRDTHFRFLQRLAPGDTLHLQTADGTGQAYAVRGAAVVDHRDAVLVQPRFGAALALVTCYPFDALTPGGPLRYVVQAEMVETMVVDAGSR